MNSDVYQSYWLRKRILTQSAPYFPVRRWWPSDELCEIEQIYFQYIKNAKRLLDFGAGDLRIMKKFQHAGFRGEYHTLDISEEYSYTYRQLSEIDGSYDAILCLDVIEYLSLEDGINLLTHLCKHLNIDGIIIVQIPNARCVRNPLGWDMTHIHLYNLPICGLFS